MCISPWVKPCHGDLGGRSESGRSSGAWASPRTYLILLREANTKVLPTLGFLRCEPGSSDMMEEEGGKGGRGLKRKGKERGKREREERRVAQAMPYLCRFLG